MLSCNALSLTSRCNDWLTNSRHPRILHVFEHACNLINEYREVLSIVMPEIGNGPFNLVIESDICFFDHLRLKCPISISANKLCLGDLTINTTKATLWNPYPDWEALHAGKESILNQLIQLRIKDYEFSNSVLFAFSAALVKADISTAKAAASQLAGLGAGLTPAGDDFMTGALYAAWIIHPADIARVLAEEIANTAAPLTTSLSAAWLRSAGSGAAGVLWHDFFNALISLDSTQIGEVMDKILGVGETSGADALAGFVGSFVAWMQKAGTAHG